MNPFRSVTTVALVSLFAATSGCAAPKVDFDSIQRPARAPEMAAYEAFIGKWTWEATMLNVADEQDAHWSGTAEWKWALDQRALYGLLKSRSARTELEAHGAWGWDAGHSRYYFWIVNNWGHPQKGKARYDSLRRHWTLDYVGVGLDGTKSHGRYEIRFVDDDTFEWSMTEWATPLRMVKKFEMSGTYRREK